MPRSFRFRPKFRRNRSREPSAFEPIEDERLLALSRQLRGDVVEALVAEGERVWDSLSRRLTDHVARIQEEARGDIHALEQKVHDQVSADVSASSTERLDSELGKAFEGLRAYREELDLRLSEASSEAQLRLAEIEEGRKSDAEKNHAALEGLRGEFKDELSRLHRGLESIAMNIALGEHDLRNELKDEIAAGKEGLDELVNERVRSEFDLATERVARLLMIERRQTEAFLERELTQIREEIRGSKVVVTRAEMVAPGDAPTPAQALSVRRSSQVRNDH
jgi:hypothetical protein